MHRGWKKVEKGKSNPSIPGGLGLKKVESLLGLNLSTLPGGPELLELATTLRKTFGPLRISGSLVGKPDPDWTRWPRHTAADMASARPDSVGRKRR